MDVRGTKKAERMAPTQERRSPPPVESMQGYPPLTAPAAPAAPAATTPAHTAAPAPTPTTPTAPFLDVGAVVRQEMFTILRELKTTPAPPPPPSKEKVIWDILRGNKDEMRSILRELGYLGF